MTATEMTIAVRGEIVNRFNTLLGEFIRKLIQTYPDDAVALKTMYNKLLLAMAADPSLVIGKYIEFGREYGALIDAQDEALFLAHAESIPGFEQVHMLANWTVTPADTKAAVWSYISTLHRLSQSYAKTDLGAGSNAMAEAMPAAMAEVFSASTALLEEFQAKEGRMPTEQDDMSDYSCAVADKLGVDLDCLKDLDVAAIEGEIANMQLPGELGKQLGQGGTKKMTKFIMRQLQNLKTKQARRSKIQSLRHEQASA